MLELAKAIAEATSKNGNLLAGGTDYMDRLRHGLIDGEIVDIIELPGLDQIESGADGQTIIGAMTTMFNVSQATVIQQSYAGLAQAAGGLATPQIRLIGTIGGNLTQATRCQYFRHPHLKCTKKGNAVCGGRDGYHQNGVIFDSGGCAHPHPSTLGMALLAYAAEIEINGQERRPIAALYGDGSNHQRDHLLADGEIITNIILPAPLPEKAAYFRAAARARAEWALVEAVARLVIGEDDTIDAAYIAVGAVAPVPMRLPAVEAALVGKPANDETFIEAAVLAAEGANPLRDTGYKVPLLVNTVAETLRRAVGLV